METKGYEIVKQIDSPDVSIRKSGNKAGFVDLNINKSEKGYYFIKFDNDKSLDDNIIILQNINFQNDKKSKYISKKELIEKLNHHLNFETKF